MEKLFAKVTIQVNEHVYVKDPESSELGKKILKGSIELLDEIGFESFTFSKLGRSIGSPEASIYRYFESKHKLLLYLINWYWGWLEYKLVFATANINDPHRRLDRAIEVLTEQAKVDGSFAHINERKLNRIVNTESSKAYLNREVDEGNELGIYASYKRLVARVVETIREINPDFKYPHMLVSTAIEAAHLQRFFGEHIPGLTNNLKGEDSPAEFCKEMIKSTISKPQ